MNYAEKIEELISENELLQLQLTDLEASLQKKDREIGYLADSMETVASLQSRIAGNMAEIEQLKYNNEQAAQKTVGVEMMNEELEMSLLKEIRGRQKDEAEIKSLGSVRTELDIVTGELEETTALYTRIQALETELAEANSRAALHEAENQSLKEELAEMTALMQLVKKQKFD